ncbi:MAG: trigger factor [Burkholderiaceae bacterium]|nr:trigger factor [Burkholderiaceae bacterium]
MATQLESTGSLERKLDMAVAVADVNRQVVDRLRKLSRNVKMPGFRPGKVPMKMIEQSYGPQVHAEVLSDAVSRAFSEAVTEHRLRVAGQPRIESRDTGTESEIGFTATFEVYPEIALGDPSGLSIERFESPVGEAEIDRTIEILRRQRVRWNEVERPAQDGDRLTIDFVGRIDDVAFEGGSAQGFPFVLGEGRMLPDFEVGLRGAALGETRSFPVAFPADYGSAELAGKTAQFEATVRKIEAPELPAVDEAFARQLGVADGDVARLRSDIRANLEREVAQRLRARTKSSVMDALLQLASFDVPKSLVDAEKQALGERAVEDLKARGLDPKQLPEIPPDTFAEQAERRVRLGLIVAEIVRAHSLQAKPDQIRRQIEEFAQAYENPGEVIRHYFGDRNRLAEVEAIVVEQNVVDWALDKAQASARTLDFDELMGPR